jgi:hypothetical protein
MTNWQRWHHYGRRSPISCASHGTGRSRDDGSEERASTIGRPLGAPGWTAALERQLGRRLAPGKPGPKPRMDGDTKRQPPLLSELQQHAASGEIPYAITELT